MEPCGPTWRAHKWGPIHQGGARQGGHKEMCWSPVGPSRGPISRPIIHQGAYYECCSHLEPHKWLARGICPFFWEPNSGPISSDPLVVAQKMQVCFLGSFIALPPNHNPWLCLHSTPSLSSTTLTFCLCSSLVFESILKTRCNHLLIQPCSFVIQPKATTIFLFGYPPIQNRTLTCLFPLF